MSLKSNIMVKSFFVRYILAKTRETQLFKTFSNKMVMMKILQKFCCFEDLTSARLFSVSARFVKITLIPSIADSSRGLPKRFMNCAIIHPFLLTTKK